MPSEQPSPWRQRSARAHRLSYGIEYSVRWIGAMGVILALVAVIIKAWWS